MPKQATRKVHLTKRSVDAIPIPKAGRIHIYDDQAAGLGVRVEANGRRSYFWFRKVAGRPVFKAIGAVSDVSIEKARGTAHEWNGALEEWKRHGYQGDDDPFARRRSELTLAELFDLYIERRLKKKATQPEKAEKETRAMFKKYLDRWRSYKLGQIHRKDVRELHDELSRDNGKITADRVAQLLRRLYYWAGSEKVELWSGDNPATKIEFNGDNQRERFLSPDELVRLDAALKKEANRDVRDFVEMALATGARRGNVLGMEWAQIDEVSGTWTIPKPQTKNKTPQVVVLAPRALGVLARRRHLRQSSLWVFPSPRNKDKHLAGVKKPWAQLLKRAKIEDFTVHDLRRTNASYQSIAGQSLQAIAATMGHRSTVSTAIYARLNSEAVRASLQAGAQMMERSMAAAKKKNKQLKAAKRG